MNVLFSFVLFFLSEWVFCNQLICILTNFQFFLAFFKFIVYKAVFVVINNKCTFHLFFLHQVDKAKHRHKKLVQLFSKRITLNHLNYRCVLFLNCSVSIERQIISMCHGFVFVGNNSKVLLFIKINTLPKWRKLTYIFRVEYRKVTIKNIFK